MEKASENKSENTPKKMTLKDFFSLGEFWGYFFRKKDPSRPSNFNLKAMHGINKLSIAIFIIAVVYLVLRKII